MSIFLAKSADTNISLNLQDKKEILKQKLLQLEIVDLADIDPVT